MLTIVHGSRSASSSNSSSNSIKTNNGWTSNDKYKYCCFGDVVVVPFVVPLSWSLLSLVLVVVGMRWCMLVPWCESSSSGRCRLVAADWSLPLAEVYCNRATFNVRIPMPFHCKRLVNGDPYDGLS